LDREFTAHEHEEDSTRYWHSGGVDLGLPLSVASRIMICQSRVLRKSTILVALFTIGLSGCGGSNGSTTQNPPPSTQAPAITSANSTTFVEGTAGSFTVTATGTPTPSISESGALPGGVTFNAGTLSGTPTASGTFPITFTAQNGTTPNATQNFTLTVSPPAPPPLTITTTTLPNGVVGTAYSATMNATGGVTPYTWSAPSSNLPAGLSISSSGTITGTPTTMGTSTFTIEVADSENPAVTATASLSITITAQVATCTNNTNLSGGYAMMLRGWAGSSYGNLFEGGVGSFQADGNGNITQGLLDVNSYLGPAQETFAGTYCLASNNLGTMTISPSAYPGSRTLAFSLQPNGNGNIIFYDTDDALGPIGGGGGFEGSGLLRKQQSTPFSNSEFSGSYAFGFVGADGGAPRLAEAGVLTVDGNGNITSGEFDFNEGGTVSTGTIIPAGSVYSVASTGRGTATIISTTSSPVDLVFYVVNSSEVLFLQDNSPVVAGQALLQTGTFGNASLSGNIVIEMSEAQAGILTATGNGSFTFSTDVYGTAPLNTGSGDYLVASNGRVALSNVTGVLDDTPCEGTCTPPVFYLVSQNTGFVVGTTPEAVFGQMEWQLGSDFNNASLTGNCMGGSAEPVGPAVGEEVDSLNFSGDQNIFGMGTVTGTADQNGPGSDFVTYSPTSTTISGTYIVSSNGRAVVTIGSQTIIIYIISDDEFVALTTGFGNDSYLNNPYLVDFDQ
jgi:hypothetical protein